MLCKYCTLNVEEILAEGLQCVKCGNMVHVSCLKRGSVPGGLEGDVFYSFTCSECTEDGNEGFVRDRMPWFQAIVLILYHISAKNPGLARRGYFHWKMHIAALLDKNCDVLFGKDFKQRKQWVGTLSGILSSYSPVFFKSGTKLFSEGGWWKLTFAKLTPAAITKINTQLVSRKINYQKHNLTDFNVVFEAIRTMGFSDEDLAMNEDQISEVDVESTSVVKRKKEVSKGKTKRTLLPTLEQLNEGSFRKLFKLSSVNVKENESSSSSPNSLVESEKEIKSHNFMDPMCHYNTCLNKDLLGNKGEKLFFKITGGVREESILSPYSSLYLKPYIRRDTVRTPNWLRLMGQVLLRTHLHEKDYVLPPRSSIDYVYIQPSHIPAINSLCNQFFWPGIDLTECLQYPDFSCVVLYKRLIVGFALAVPDVRLQENYISFVFVRPGWRNIGIGRFMIYHLIQTSMGKDLTLHVSLNNMALLLYQKFGFKVENVCLNFYDKYYPKDSLESKHAFFCRLER